MKKLTIKEYAKTTGIHITTEHNGKMEGFWSLSTSPTVNKFCKRMHNCGNDNCICTKCYATAMAQRYSNLSKALVKNAEILTTEILEVVPIITNLYFRFNAFGELNNTTELINYFNICNGNKSVKFALWTKRPEIIKEVLTMGYTKPKNLQIVISSPMVNEVKDISKYDFADKVFTVHTCDYAISNNVNINCGSKSCASCTKCYTKNKVTEIAEMLKSEQNRYNKLSQ